MAFPGRRAVRCESGVLRCSDPGSIFEKVPALRRNVPLRRVRDTKRRP
jgi:hypothetical protein